MVRQIAPGEGQQLRELRLRALTDAPGAFLMTAEQEAADPPERWDRLADTPTDVVVFVDDGWHGMVGAKRAADVRVELWGLWVAPEARRNGLGADLVRAVFDWAGDDAAVTLCVLDDAPELLAFYRRLGFTATGPPEPLQDQPGRSIQSFERRKLSPGPFAAHLGFRVVHSGDDGSVLEADPRPEHLNGAGIVHGGYLTSLLDSATGWAVHAQLPPGVPAPHVQLSVQFVRAALAGSTLVCRGRCLSAGKRIASAEAEITQGDTVIARAVTSHAIMQRRNV